MALGKQATPDPRVPRPPGACQRSCAPAPHIALTGAQLARHDNRALASTAARAGSLGQLYKSCIQQRRRWQLSSGPAARRLCPPACTRAPGFCKMTTARRCCPWPHKLDHGEQAGARSTLTEQSKHPSRLPDSESHLGCGSASRRPCALEGWWCTARPAAGWRQQRRQPSAQHCSQRRQAHQGQAKLTGSAGLNAGSARGQL